MATWETTFEITAPASRVWEVLTDFARYGEWNPQVPKISGDLSVGSTLSMSLVMPRRPTIKAKAKVLEVSPEKALVWEGKILSNRVFVGHREFRIRPAEKGSVLVTHVERLTGPLVPVFLLINRKAVDAGHHGLNLALTNRCEAK